jgi:hypothetical protein
LDKKSKHIKARNNLIFEIGNLVVFTVDAIDISIRDKEKIWIIKDFVNKTPEEFSIYDYVITDGNEDIVAIEYELKLLREE